MRYRQSANKPSIALWMLVAVGDIALFLATAGVAVIVAIASVVTVAVGGGWLLLRRRVADREVMPARVALASGTRQRARTAGQPY
ncbi:hypothetical protein [Plantactinospora sp. CA-290183]|uniref:hypothetical protein n=1 Tax=Plantactinospora sp. CA-290183 TaxID=3240006 RepID=UPI003D8D5E22